MMKLALGKFALVFSISRQERRGLSRRRGACRRQRSAEELEARIVLAAINPLNVLVSDGTAIHEFTQSGTLVQSFPIPDNGFDESDLIVDDNGIGHVFNGGDVQNGPVRSSLDPTTEHGRQGRTRAGIASAVTSRPSTISCSSRRSRPVRARPQR